MGIFGPTRQDVREAYRRGKEEGRREVWRSWLNSLFRPPHIPMAAPDDLVADARREAEQHREARGI